MIRYFGDSDPDGDWNMTCEDISTARHKREQPNCEHCKGTGWVLVEGYRWHQRCFGTKIKPKESAS